MQLSAPIVAVTVHPERARITRRGRAAVPTGSTELVVADLPSTLLDESVRVAGRAATAARVIGVDLHHRDLADVPDERVRAAEAAVRDAERALAVIDGEDAADAAREEMLARLARRSGDQLAAALADGRAGTARIGEVGAAVAAQLVEVATSRRGHEERRVQARRVLAAAQAELARLQGSGRHRREAVIAVEADTDGELELELSYVVQGAGWSSAYDARLAPDQGATGQLALTWYGMVTQATGEDWPECELTLSTAHPAAASVVPELQPWWIDVRRPAEPIMMAAMDAAMPMAAKRERAAAATPAAMDVVVAEAVNGTVAASWRLRRPTAVPADGTPHRTTVATFELPARLDHVTAPAQGPDAHLRATITNSTGQVLLAGSVSTFVGDAFVGTTALSQTAPGADIELALGVDDRVVVDRELVDRTAHKARFGTTRGAVERWTITVSNHRTAPARVLVRDRLPVSRHADIKVVDVSLSPEPAERDELGRLEWVATLAPDQKWQASIRYGVEHPKETQVAGWGS
ncbi:MAG TPA: mucoidy inhibitor MuiA family protein [Pseudonocardia sp.]|nr:mucoidy inhibitor MuiA family protein [Pseudonocardia sp.]